MEKITFTEDQLDLAKTMAKRAEIGGKSQIRQRSSRQHNLAEDQLVGQLGELAASIALTGNEDAYVQHRQERNKNPHLGDDGTDIKSLDVKASRMRYGQDPTAYNLVVRPAERGRGKSYLPVFITNDMKHAYIMQQVTDQHLEKYGRVDPRFGNATCIQVTKGG
jgi:hypothetical protein